MYIILGIFFQCLIKLIDQLAMACTVIKLSSRHLGILCQTLPGAILIQLIQDILNDGILGLFHLNRDLHALILIVCHSCHK